jgi:tetratricopeptide (TPR) repeat protein
MPIPVDRDIHLAQALLVEGNAVLRSVAASQLREAGVGEVTAVARLREARLALERQRFDVVLCNREFEGEIESGQDLLDELRRERLLPHSTVFFMVTQQAAFHQVIEAAGAALDGLLLRPYTTAALHRRLQEARRRKRELATVLRALDAGESERALTLALNRFQQGAPYAFWCGYVAAELLLDLKRPQDARQLFEKLHGARPQARALLGMARAMAAAGDLGGARRLLEPMLAEDPTQADAHDLHGRLLLEQGHFEAALAAYRQAAELTPGCLLRAQHAGALAYYQGQQEEARRWLEQCLRLGVLSRLFDAWSLLLLALLRFDATGGVTARGGVAASNAATGLAPLCEQLQRYQQRHPQSQRLRRLTQAADWLHALAASSGNEDAAARAGEQAHVMLAALGEEATADETSDGFDFEAANVWLALWSRLPAPWRHEPQHLHTVHLLALRFSHGRATTEALCGAAARDVEAVARIRGAHAEVQALAEQAMVRSLNEQPEAAAQLLLDAGLRTRNAKLLELAVAVIRRQTQPGETLQQQLLQALKALDRCGRPSTHIAGIERAGRSAPGMRLRPPPTTGTGRTSPP